MISIVSPSAITTFTIAGFASTTTAGTSPSLSGASWNTRSSAASRSPASSGRLM